MASQTFEVSENLTITVPECLGDLTIKGADSATVTVKASIMTKKRTSKSCRKRMH